MIGQKKNKLFVLGAIIGIVCLFLLSPLLIKNIVIGQLQKICPQAQVRISTFQWHPWRWVRFSGVSLRHKSYTVEVKTVQCSYSFARLMKGTVDLISIDSLNAKITMPHQPLSDFVSLFQLKPGKSLGCKGVSIGNSKIDIVSKDVTANSTVNIDVEIIPDLNIKSIYCTMESFQGFQSTLRNLICEGANNRLGITADSLKIDKFTCNKIKGLLNINNDAAQLTDVSAQIFDGEMKVEAFFKRQELQYTAKLSAQHINIAEIIRALEFQEKMDMNGFLHGTLELQGGGANVSLIDGDFTTEQGGGTLVIKDESMLKGMIPAQALPADLFMESLKNYQYNNGIVTLSLEEQNVVFDINLDGQAGKRSLRIVTHGLPFIGRGK